MKLLTNILYPIILKKKDNVKQDNRSTFIVKKSTNKNKLKYFVESLFNIDVVKINILHMPRKTKKSKGKTLHRKKFKKAYIKTANKLNTDISINI